MTQQQQEIVCKIKSYRMLTECLDKADSSARAEIDQAQEWGGADVIITSSKAVIRENRKPNEWFPAATDVFTPHAKAASWLIYKLQKNFDPWLDYMNKYEFYGRLAEAVKAAGTKASEKQVLMSMLDEAEKMAGELVKVC